MKIQTSTDNKYIGTDIPDNLKVGDIVLLGDFVFDIQSIRVLENGQISYSNTNFQLQCEE